MKLGAVDFLTTPFDPDHPGMVIQKALGWEPLKREVAHLRSGLDGRYSTLVAESTNMKDVVIAAKRDAASGETMLIEGKTGTVKELLTRSIQYTEEVTRWLRRSAGQRSMRPEGPRNGDGKPRRTKQVIRELQDGVAGVIDAGHPWLGLPVGAATFIPHILKRAQQSLHRSMAWRCRPGAFPSLADRSPGSGGTFMGSVILPRVASAPSRQSSPRQNTTIPQGPWLVVLFLLVDLLCTFPSDDPVTII